MHRHSVRLLSILLSLCILYGFSTPALAASPSVQDETIIEDFKNGYWFFESQSQGVRIEIHRKQDEKNKVLWYEADLRCSPQAPLQFFTANEKEPGKGFFYAERLLREKKTVFGINDDQFGHRMYNHKTLGVIVRNGQVISNKTHNNSSLSWPTLDVAAFFADGTMQVFESKEHTAEEYIKMGAHTVLSFGPWLVRDGQINPLLDKISHIREPRSAIGIIEPNHYIVVSVEGRVKQSGGVKLQWLAEKMSELGASQAFNLDGGKTCCILFMGKKLQITNPKGLVRKERSVSGLISLGTSDQVPPYTGLEE